MGEGFIISHLWLGIRIFSARLSALAWRFSTSFRSEYETQSFVEIGCDNNRGKCCDNSVDSTVDRELETLESLLWWEQSTLAVDDPRVLDSIA